MEASEYLREPGNKQKKVLFLGFHLQKHLQLLRLLVAEVEEAVSRVVGVQPLLGATRLFAALDAVSEGPLASDAELSRWQIQRSSLGKAFKIGTPENCTVHT